jgi:beta-galactosidase
VGASNHAGGANWIFSDSTSGGRVATEVARAGGEVDGVRLPKEAYYVCAAMFRSDPQVHIVGHWTYPAGTKKTVYVASNADEVELSVNGKLLRRAKPENFYLFTFPDVVWTAGEIKAVAYIGGKAVATDSKHTVGPPVALRMSTIAAPGGCRADGSDILLIDVEAVDAKGDRCPTFQKRVEFETTGPGIWRGSYNSGKIKSTNNTYLDLESGINRVSVRATRTAGAVTVKVSGAGLRPASVTVSSILFPVQNGYSTVMPAMANLVPVKPAAPPHEKLLDTAAGAAAGRYVKSLSYSGPASGVHVERDAQNGRKIYVEGASAFANLPDDVVGADYVQASVADRQYSAVDLMEVAVGAGGTVWIAHDDRLPRPSWLTTQFQQMETTAITVDGKRMHLVHLILEVVPQGGRVVILQVPVDAIETDMRREDARLGSGQPVVGICRALDGRRRGAGHGADQTTLRIEDLELEGRARLVAEIVIHDRAVRHIRRMGHFDGEGLIPIAVDACANGLLGLEEKDGIPHQPER